MNQRFIDYCYGSAHEKVEGWVHRGAATSIKLFTDYHRDNGIEGSLSEIGVHHGRYFLDMAHHSNASEQMIAVDLFEDQHLNPNKFGHSSGKGDRGKFLSNIDEYGPEGLIERVTLIKGDSMTLSASDLRGGLKGFRLFSVDGGHEVHHVLNDLKLAEDTLVPGGVIVLDDFFHPGWPSVTEGLFNYFRDTHTDLKAIAYGDNKLYLTQSAYVLSIREFLLAQEPHILKTKWVDMLSEDCVMVKLNQLTPQT